jgi:rubrerythrin
MIDSLRDFLHYAVRLEAEAARGYERLAASMQAQGQDDVAQLFAKLGRFSLMHLKETQDLYRRHVGSEPDLDSPIRWPDGHSPENPDGGHRPPAADVHGAMLLALSLERHACDFYSMVANQSRDAQVQELAQEFADEEAEHVEHLQRWLQRHRDQHGTG